MLYRFSRWWLLQHNFTSGFTTGDFALFRMSVVISKPYSVIITQSAAEITISDFENRRPPYWNSTSGFGFDHITTVGMSFCISLRNFYPNRTAHSRRMTSCQFARWRISAILDLRGPIMGSLKSPRVTSCRPRSSMETIALYCSGCEKIVFLRFGDRQTDGQARCIKLLSLSGVTV